jgi:hypothetical protein
MKNPDIIEAIRPIIRAFEEHSIPYYVGGSVASSLYGMARATMDVDLVADIKAEHIIPLKSSLEHSYYIDEEMILEATRRKSSLNLIHLETMIKIDVFISKDEPYQRKALERKRLDTIEEGDASDEFYFSSPEDIILNKLHWYEIGNRLSERQWLDIIGVIKIQGNLLDLNYLEQWAKKLQLWELLEKAYQDAGISR